MNVNNKLNSTIPPRSVGATIPTETEPKTYYENHDPVEVDLLNDKPDSRTRNRKPITYAAKKTVAQGMMDLALITSNANQLKNLIEYQSRTATFYFVLFLIVVSLVLQIAVGVSLIFKSRFDTKGKDKAAAARVNKWVMAAVFLITIINIFIAVFSTGAIIPTNNQPGLTNSSN